MWFLDIGDKLALEECADTKLGLPAAAAVVVFWLSYVKLAVIVDRLVIP